MLIYLATKPNHSKLSFCVKNVTIINISLEEVKSFIQNFLMKPNNFFYFIDMFSDDEISDLKIKAPKFRLKKQICKHGA